MTLSPVRIRDPFSRGLRLGQRVVPDEVERSNQRPVLKGIKTSIPGGRYCVVRSNQRPVLKGIKTHDVRGLRHR